MPVYHLPVNANNSPTPTGESSDPVNVNSSDGNYVPKGYEQITGLSSVKSLTPPADSILALISVVSQGVRWLDDGASPTSTNGMVIAADTDFSYDGDLSVFKLLELAVSAEVNVSYYGLS